MGSHELQVDGNHPVSHFRRYLAPRSGTRLEYGYTVVHTDLEGGSGSFSRTMPPGEADIATSFNGYRIYYANLVDDASGLEYVAVRADGGLIMEVTILNQEQDTNPFYQLFRDIKPGQLATNVFNDMALAYLELIDHTLFIFL